MGLHDGHRQRKRQQFLSHGPESMADHELLELALFYAIPRRDTNETAHRAVSLVMRENQVVGTIRSSWAPVVTSRRKYALFSSVL